MIDGGVEILALPAISGLLKRLEAHAGADAPEGQWGYYPGAKGEILTKEMAKKVPESEKFIGKQVFDANALVETYVELKQEGTAEERMKFQYDEWCYGHIGDVLEEMVQLPGGAVFKVDQEGRFEDVAYLYRKWGAGPLDWEIFVCSDPKTGLCIQKLDESWNRWGLISMILRYDVKGPMQEGLAPLPEGTSRATVGSSVLNFRCRPDEKLITSLPNGTQVELTGRTEGNWTEVKLGEITGFVFSKFLVRD